MTLLSRLHGWCVSHMANMLHILAAIHHLWCVSIAEQSISWLSSSSKECSHSALCFVAKQAEHTVHCMTADMHHLLSALVQKPRRGVH